jgi:hypothetical protein
VPTPFILKAILTQFLSLFILLNQDSTLALLNMPVSLVSALCALFSFISIITPSFAQQFVGAVVNNTMPSVPGSELTYFNIVNKGNKDTTVINYSSLAQPDNSRLKPSDIQRAVIFVHGLNRDPQTYIANMMTALSQVSGRPDVNFRNVQSMLTHQEAYSTYAD